MKKQNKWEKAFKELGIDLSSSKPTATQTKAEHHSYKEAFNSTSYKKWAKKMEEMYEEEYRVNILDFLLAEYHEEMIAKPIKLSPSRVIGKKKGKKR